MWFSATGTAALVWDCPDTTPKTKKTSVATRMVWLQGTGLASLVVNSASGATTVKLCVKNHTVLQGAVDKAGVGVVSLHPSDTGGEWLALFSSKVANTAVVCFKFTHSDCGQAFDELLNSWKREPEVDQVVPKPVSGCPASNLFDMDELQAKLAIEKYLRDPSFSELLQKVDKALDAVDC